MEVGCSGDSQIEIGVVFPTKRTRMPLRAAGRRVSNCYCRSYVATGDVAVSTAGPLQGLTRRWRGAPARDRGSRPRACVQRLYL